MPDATLRGRTRTNQPSTRDRVIEAARGGLTSGRVPPLAAIADAAGVSRATVHRAVGSRSDLLRLLAVEPDPSARERVISEAVVLLGSHGLARLSMEELADRAGVSRANLYRLFPGKAALFREVVRVHAPFTAVAAALVEHGDDPPEVLMPLLARSLLGGVRGRVGLVRTLLVEVSGAGGDAELARELALVEMIGPLVGYVTRQMAEGRLRRADPVVALQAFAGPLIMHLITRDILERALGFDLALEDVAGLLAASWLRAMRPGPAEEP
jgi:AcrR family transcriptional regulator